MNEQELTGIVEQVRALVEARYLYPEVAVTVSRTLAEGLTEGRYPAEAPALAVAVTADLQSVNGDKHLRLVHHEETLPERTPGDDSEEFAAMARWADQTGGGVACARRLAGNVGYLDLQPVLFPAVIAGEFIAAAMTLLATADALIIDLRRCLGGEPAMVSFLVSYLWDREPVQLSGLRERGDSQPRQAWTVPYVPGRRPGKATPAYVLTSAATFSGGEALSYDLQQLGRATIIGERTRGGANAREGFRVHPHLEATISVAEAVHPKTGTNWEGTGVTPDIQATAAQARDIAYGLALQDVIKAGGDAAAEASTALAATQSDTRQRQD
jgi:Peptidase family S41/N-terminal domain of Peptidase_S41 in eukaryotic IRBP